MLPKKNRGEIRGLKITLGTRARASQNGPCPWAKFKNSPHAQAGAVSESSLPSGEIQKFAPRSGRRGVGVQFSIGIGSWEPCRSGAEVQFSIGIGGRERCRSAVFYRDWLLGAVPEQCRSLVFYRNWLLGASVRPSVCSSVRPSLRASVRPSVRLSVRRSVRPSVGPSVRPSVTPSSTL